MDERKIGLSREMIIHPGETLKEMLENCRMSQKELALRADVSEKHISKVINGLAPISASLARKIGFVFDMEPSFWQKLQSDYDAELLEFEELHSIGQDEKNIAKKLSEVFK